MPIEVFPSLLPGAPIEVHEAGEMTIGEWFTHHNLDYQAFDVQPVQVSVNGVVIPSREWATTRFARSDAVEIRILPHGGAFKALGSIIGKVFNLAFGWLIPRTRTPSSGSPEQGQALEVARVAGNQAKLGDVVPELAGRFKRYVDYLVPPRRYFQDLRYQWVTFLGCVGPGIYAINPEDVKVGDTPISALGADAHHLFFNPGTELFPYEYSQHWHTVEEVGGTSSGTPGLVLSTEVANRVNTDPPSYAFNGDYIERSSGTWPAGWGVGTVVRIEYPRPYDVVTINVPPTESAPGYQISELTGYFGHVPSFARDVVMSMGPFGTSTRYRVRSIEQDLGGGNYTIRLETVNTDDPVVLPAGLQTLIFASDIERSVIFFNEVAMSVAPSGFQNLNLPGARIQHAGGTVYGEWTSEFVATPGNETTETLEFDVFFPGGLAFIEDDGALSGRTVGIEFQYRDVNGGPRTTVMRTYTQATLDQIGMTEQFNIPSMRPACRMRRVGAESTSTQVQDKCHWYGLKARLPVRTVYPRWTTMGVALRSGGRIAAQSENKINVVATRMLARLQPDGSWGPAEPTRDISSFVRYIAQTIGYTDDDLDMAELARLHAIWTARGETLDHIYDETTVKEALDLALGAGMAELTIHDGQIRPVRDDVRTQFEQAYSPQNMTGPLVRAFRGRRMGDFDGVEVEFVNEATWTKETIKCLLPGDAGFKLEKLSLRGVTNRTRAWRIGMRRRRALRYRNWDYSFGTEMDALNSRYLSYVPLIDGDPGYGKSAILESISLSGALALLRVSEPMEWEAGAEHVVAYRREDGTLAGPFAAQPGPDEYTILADIPQPWPVVTLKREPPHVYFGTVERWSFPALITDIQPNGLETATVKATNYDVRVYASDNEFPPS